MNEFKSSASNEISEKLELQYDEKTRKLSVNPVAVGAVGASTVALISQPVFATPPTGPVADLSAAVTGLGTLAGLAATAAALPVIIYFGYRIIKRVLAGAT